jgi:AraC-like DNA-binding protein
MENRILPNTSIVMAFRYKGRLASTEGGVKNGLPASVITGLRKSARLINYSRDTATLLVMFKEGGAPAFFDEPLHELFGTTLALEQLIHRHMLDNIEEQLAEAGSNRQRISIVERFLLSMLKKPQPDELILLTIQRIRRVNGNIRITDLVTGLPISMDPFEKRFRRIMGTSPKQFARIVRLRNFVDKYPQSKNLTEAALMAGYYDQAHLIKDFKTFARQTPKDFFRSPPNW